MSSIDEPDVIAIADAPLRRGRLKALFTSARTIARIAWRDPQKLPERLMLAATDRFAEPARIWAEAALIRRADDGPVKIAADLRQQSALVARVDGAIAGTPFFIALVPGYVGYLWQEAVMLLRTAALFGRDPAALRTTAELLVLRGIHPTVDAAEASLTHVIATPLPEKPTERRPLRLWVTSVRMVLVIGGFMGPPDPDDAPSRGRLAVVASLAVAGGLWVVTSLLPLTLMVAMAWGCEHDARELGWRALLFYSGDASDPAVAALLAERRHDAGHDARQIIRSVLLFLSVAVPIGFVAFADHVRNSTGVNGVGALGALVALSLVIAMSVFARSR